MPIYEESYQSWFGALQNRPRTWWVIGKTGVKLLWKKGLILFILLSSIPFFVRAVQIYLMSRFSQQAELITVTQAVRGLKIDPYFFMNFIKGQMFFVFLIFIFAGAGLIANDRKYNALSIYFSKPVGFWDYIGGKFLIISFYGSLITFVPALILFLMQVILDQNMFFLTTHFWIPLSLFGYTLLILVTLGMLMLALSAVSKGTGWAAIFFFALLTFPESFRQILSRVPDIGLISLNADLRQVAAFLFGLETPFDFSVWLALLVLLIVILGSFLILRMRVKPTEVIR